MNVFGVTIIGDHPTQASHRFFGLAEDAQSAIDLACIAAFDQGWSSVQVDDLSRLGPVGFDQQDTYRAGDTS